MGLHGQRRARGDDLGHPARLGIDVVGDRRHESERLRLVGVHGAPGQQQVEGDTLTGDAGEPRRRDREAQLDPDAREPGCASGHANVARQRQLEAAPVRISVDGGDGDTRKLRDRREHGLVRVEERLRLVGRQLCLVAQVGTRAERAASSADDDSAQPAGPEIGKRVEQLSAQRVGQQVQGRGVERQDADGALDRDIDAQGRPLRGNSGLPAIGLFGARGVEPGAPCGP